MPRYVAVDETAVGGAGPLVMPSGDVSLLKEVEALKRSQLEEKHELTDALADLKRSLEGLRGQLGEVRARASKPAGLTEQDVKKLIVDCAKDPSNPVCQVVRSEAEQAAKKVAQSFAPISPDAEEEEHHTAEDFLRCPQCSPKFLEAAKQVDEWKNAFLDGLADTDVERLLENLRSEGWTVEKPTEEKETAGFPW